MFRSARAVQRRGHRAVHLRGGAFQGPAMLCCVGTSLLFAACASERASDEPDPDGSDAGSYTSLPDADVRLRFEPGSDDAVAFGDVPWPSDLYLDTEGRIAVGALPGPAAESALTQQLRDAVGRLEGFGAMGPILFYFDGAIDSTSLPVDASASMEDDAAVFVIDVDTNSPQPFERVPVETHFHADSAQLAVVPARGHALAPGRRYAAVVTRQLRDADGAAVGPTEAFVAAMGAEAPDEPARLARAHASFSPVLTQLEAHGVARRDVIGLAVFRVQGVTEVLGQARALVRGEPTAFTVVDVLTDLDALLGVPEVDVSGLDLAGGVLHTGIGGMVRGRLSSKDFLVGEDGTRGRFEHDDLGNLIIKRVDEVPFTIWMPPAPVLLGSLPVVIYVHDLHADRSDSVVAANRLSAAGYAVVAVDLPFHGSRSAGPDELNRFTGQEVPDGFGDGRGDFVGRFEEGSALLPLHPALHRGAVRQSVVDVMQLIHMIESGDFTTFFEGTEYAGLAFDRERIGLLGVGVGGEVGLIAATMEDSLGAVEALFPGGHVVDAWASSPARQGIYAELTQALGIGAPEDADDFPVLLRPAMALYQTVLDGGDPQLLAGALRRTPVNALIVMAADDEVVPNHSTEALALAVGAQLVSGSAAHVPQLQSLNADGAVSGNFMVADDIVTRLVTRADPATHDALVHRTGTRTYEPALSAPFVELSQPLSVANPLDELLEQSVAFFDTWRICAAGNAAASCPASVMPLQ